MANIYDWSTTAASNNTAGSGNWSEGQAPSTVNDAARATMADVAKWRDFLGGAKVSSGTDTITLTSGLSITAYAQGMMFAFEAGGTNTGAATLNVDSVGAKAIKKHHDVALAAGDIEAGGIYIVAYEAASDEFLLVSPTANAPFADPMTTRGDILYRNPSNATARLAVGAADTALMSDGTDPSWTGVVKQGTHTVWVPAGAMRPTVSNGCAALTDVETTAGRPDLQVLDFDASSDEHAQFQIAFPKSWNEGTVTFQVYWTSTAVDTDGVTWALQGVACSDGDTADVAYGTAVTVDDANQSTAEDVYITAESGAVTIAGTPAAGDLCFFRIFRDVSDVNDTAVEDARLIGVKVLFTIDAGDDS